MDCRTLHVTIVSAEGLKKVRRFGKMQTYAIAWVDPYQRFSTQVDKDGGTRPAWNQNLSIPVPEFYFQQPNSRLTVEIYSLGSVFGKSFVGATLIPLSEILQQSNQEDILTYQLKRRSDKVKGSLRLSVRVREKATVEGSRSAPSSFTAYPSVYDYRQQPQQPYYPQQQYSNYQAYPPQQYPSQGYGGQAYYPPVQQPQYVQPPRRSGMGGMGFGTGLLAGAVGGLIVGEVIDDMAFNNGGFGGGGFDGGGFGGGYDGGGFGGGYDGGGFDGGGFGGGYDGGGFGGGGFDGGYDGGGFDGGGGF